MVFDKATSRNISGASISLSQAGSSISSIITGSDGAYIFQVLPGNYSIKAFKIGFKEGKEVVNIASFETVSKDIGLVPVKTGTDAKQTLKSTGAQSGSLNNTGTFPGFIKGSVSDDVTGNALSMTTVTLKQSGLMVASAITQDEGTYFFQLPPGNYNLIAFKSGFNEAEVDVAISPFETVTRHIPLSPSLAVPTPTATPLAPTPLPTPAPLLTPSPPLPECEQGGIPSGISLSSQSLMIRAGTTRRVKVHVWRDQILLGCSVEVKIDTREGGEKLNRLPDTITTNRLGNARVKISAKKGVTGRAIVVFSVGDIKAELPVVIISKSPSS